MKGIPPEHTSIYRLPLRPNGIKGSLGVKLNVIMVNSQLTHSCIYYNGNVLEMVLKYELNYVVSQTNLINGISIFVM